MWNVDLTLTGSITFGIAIDTLHFCVRLTYLLCSDFNGNMLNMI
jgi:hypothetical protein